MAAKARAENEALAKRVADLEARLGDAPAKASPAKPASAKPKAAPRPRKPKAPPAAP
ncbi:MAG: hypothetical protein AB1918_12335 [Pseudomonadota bacterium]